MLERVQRKRSPWALLAEMYVGAATVEQSYGDSSKKFRLELTNIEPNYSTSGFLSREHENTNLKRHAHPDVCCSITKLQKQPTNVHQ